MILFDRNPSRNDEVAHWERVEGLLAGQVHALADPNESEKWGGIIDGTFHAFNNTAVNSPFVYWPSLLSGGDYRTACLLTLCASALVTAAGIILADGYGYVIAGTAILPMVFYSYLYPTADAVTNSYGLFYIGYMLHLCGKRRLGAFDYVAATIASAMLGQIKSTCVVLALLLIMPAVRQYGVRRLAFIIPAAAAAVSAGLWMHVVADIVPAPDAVPGARLESLKTAMIENPLLLLQSTLVTLFQPLDLADENVNGLPVNPQRNLQLFTGAENTQLGMAIMAPLLFAVMLLFLIGACTQKNRLQAVDRVICAITCVVFFGLTCAAMVLTWSGNLGGYAGGIQTRYFIPMIPLVVFLIPDLVQIGDRRRLLTAVAILAVLSYGGILVAHCVDWNVFPE